MGYLIYADYKRLIQSDNLQQVIANDPTTISQAEATAMEEATSRLEQKFIVSQEFQDTPAWDVSRIYAPTNRVYLDAPVFNATSTYAPGDYVTFAVSTNTTNVYVALNVVNAGPFNAADWVLIAPQYQIYYAHYPVPLFDLYQQYALYDQVFYNGNIYECIRQTSPYSQETELQFRLNESIPPNNTFPDNVNSGAQYWRFLSAYTVPAATDITNTIYWTRGDNRSQLLVTAQVACVLYWVHYRIAPRNIPDLRVKSYDDAIKWYVNCANGDVTPKLPVIQPRAGSRIRFGGPVKNINSY